MAGIYNNNRPIPGNGADFFGDKLVGNQFVDGVSQFTLGNFEIKSNISQKDSRDFSLGNFSEPVTLETLNITNTEEARILSSNRLEVFINYDRSKVSNFTLYGSLRERLKVAVQNGIKTFPAALVFKKIRDWIDFRSGNTANNISFNATTNATTFGAHLFNLYNPFSIEFTKNGEIYTDPDVSPLRNLTLEYLKYSLYFKGNEYPLSFLTPTTGNTNIGNLTIVVKGNPFSGSSASTESYYIKPNTLSTEQAFDEMGDVEQFLLERNTSPIYTAKFDQPTETSTGKIVKTKTAVTWPSTDNWNLVISGGLFESYLEKLYDIADTYDSYKTNLISRFLTTAALKEFDTFDEKVDKVLKIYGRSFDEVKKYIDGIAYMTNVTYDGVNNIPNELLKNFAQTLGWKTPSAIKNEGFLNTLFDRNKTNEYSGLAQTPTPTELDHELYRRLLANTAYLFKSKGTRKGIEFMLRFVGAPEALIEFNEHVYVAGQPLNMKQFREYELKISGGTYTEEVPVAQTYFSAATETFPPIVITGYTFGYETIVKSTTVNPELLPVDKDGYPTVPRYGVDAYFQAGAGWFEETTEHQGKKIIDEQNSVFTGNTPFVKTKLNQFTYGEPYLDLYRKFPDSKLGFPIVRTVDNKKSWVRKDSYQQRFYNLTDRGTNYQTDNDKLVINVKNVDIFLNVGQGLEWDVWNFSKKYGCPFGSAALTAPYPSIGGPDWTQILADASKLSFFEWAEKFWSVLINVKNRQTIDDGHGGGYPTLLSIYLDYLKSDQTCGIPSNNYTYEKMIAYVENMGDYWVRLLEQMVPSTTIWQGGLKYENSIFHRYKYAYKHEPLCDDLECFGSFVNCCYPITNDILVNGVLECGGLGFSGATWSNKITLNGTEYTGNTYYSSTTITDIPSTDIWLDDMVTILSGITSDLSDPNSSLQYYLINDNNTPTSLQIDQPNCIVIQGPCSGGTDMWNFNSGPDPHCFKSEICLNIQTIQANPQPIGQDIWVYYSQENGAPSNFAARNFIDNWVTSLGTSFTGNTYHAALRTQNTNWLSWASIPQAGGTLPLVSTSIPSYNGFNVLPSGTSPLGLVPAGVSDNALCIFLLSESRDYHAYQSSNSCGYNPPIGDITDWSNIVIQPNATYTNDFNTFAATFNNYDNFKGFIYGVAQSDQYKLNFPLHLYGAISTSTVSIGDLVENPTIQALEGTLSAITFSNPYTALTATNTGTAYTGPGLENFGFGFKIDGSDLCDGLTCSDPSFDGGCARQKGGSMNLPAYYTEDFPTAFLDFIESTSTITLNTCEICIPICFNDFGDGETQEYSPQQEYNYGDIVVYEGQLWQYIGNDGVFVKPPGIPGTPWSLIGDADCIPFLGGNDFREQDDCSDYSVIPENPQVTGTTITTNPEIYKETIFNVGGQDCFESTYRPCEQLTDECACDAIVGTFDIDTTQFEPGDVVCCVNGEGNIISRWIRILGDICPRKQEVFDIGLCNPISPVNNRCWTPCLTTNSGNNVTEGGTWGKETVIIPGKIPTLISNSPIDPCDPVYENPTDPCECKGIGRRNLDLLFYPIASNPTIFPQSILDFYMNEDQLSSKNWTTQITGQYKVYKAVTNICCLGDKFTNYFRVYNRGGIIPGENEISYGDIIIDLDVNQNCNIEFYLVITKNNVTKMFMYIPESTINTNATISVLDNPLLNSASIENDATLNYFVDNIKSLTFQIGKKNNNIFNLFKVEDSTYLTDNGTGSPAEELNDIFDRYWALDSDRTLFDDPVSSPLYGALETNEFQFIAQSIGDLSYQYRYNWELELSCEGQQTIELTFTALEGTKDPRDPEGGTGNLTKEPTSTGLKPEGSGQLQQSGMNNVSTTGKVPFTDACGTDISTKIINQNESADSKTKSISTIQNTGNLLKVPVKDTITEINKDIDIRNYRTIRSEIFLVSNFNPLQSNRFVNYNSPKLSRNLKEGLTYETFTENGTQRAKLEWLDDFTKQGNVKINIEFVSDENKKRFEQDLKLKNVGQGVEFLPGYNVNNTTPSSTQGKSTFVDLRDWATRSLGNVKDFSNSKITYNSDGLVKGFEIGPTYLTSLSNSQYKTGLVPIGDPKTEFLVSTMGSLEKYISYQTGTTSSAVTTTLTATSINYSGYTNLSGLTDNQGLNLSPDFVFDINLFENKISINSGVALSDPTFSEKIKLSNTLSDDFKLLGDERNLRPSIPLKTLSSDNQLVFIPREEVSTSGDYFYYKVPKTQKYRLQYKSCFYLEYFDEGWCTYLDTYRQQTNNLFPVNDYDFKQLINSSIIYAGGDLTSEEKYKEGNVVNDSYKKLGIGKKLSPIFGYNPNNGLKDFYFNVYIERKLSGTTATTVIANYTIANNPTQHPGANDYLFLPVNESDKFTNLYECTGFTATTKIFEKKFIPYIDTECIELNKDDEIRLRVDINWENTTKNYSTSSGTSGLTASTISLKVGTDYSKEVPERPWFRVINKECNVPESTTYLYWQANEKGPINSNLYSKGQAITATQGSEVGKLILTETTENLDYVTPNIRVNNLQKLTYLDLPEDKNYTGDLKLIETSKKTNRWAKSLEENKINDFKVNAPKIIEREDEIDVNWNVPVPEQDNIESLSLDDPKYTFMVESTIEVKGSEKTFTVLNTYKPDFKSDTTKDLKVDSTTLITPTNITYTSSRPLEERTIGFEDNRTIIRENIVAVESVIYDKNRPTADKGRVEYCRCGDSKYIPVPSDSNVGCDRWCCVNSYNDSTYYPCSEKTINEWSNGLNLTKTVVPVAKNGIIRGL